MNARPVSDVSDVDMSSFQRSLGELTQRACSVRLDDLPAAVRERAAMVLVDDLSAMNAGFSDAECTTLTDLMLRTGGAGEATVFNGRRRSDRYTADGLRASCAHTDLANDTGAVWQIGLIDARRDE